MTYYCPGWTPSGLTRLREGFDYTAEDLWARDMCNEFSSPEVRYTDAQGDSLDSENNGETSCTLHGDEAYWLERGTERNDRIIDDLIEFANRQDVNLWICRTDHAVTGPWITATQESMNDHTEQEHNIPTPPVRAGARSHREWEGEVAF